MSDFVSFHKGGGYSSELEDDKSSVGTPETDSIKSSGTLQFKKPAIPAVSKSTLSGISDAEQRRAYGSAFRGMNAYERHLKYMKDFVFHYARGRPVIYQSDKPQKKDHDILREEYRFIRSDEDNDTSSWEKRLAKKYYDKLFKEYALADMSRYKEGKIGFRWRTELEVISGRGQFSCGNKKCEEKKDLKSYEVNFAYQENNEKKNALVKVRLCPACAYKLQYKSLKRKKKEESKNKKRKTEQGEIEEEPELDEREEEEKLREQHRLAEEQEKAKQEQVWKQKPQLEKTKEEEFDEYFDGMFL